MTTNKSKLVNWDADFYNSLPDEFCIYCLSKKQIYVIGQALQQVHWSTRWFGDVSGLDFSAIAGELEGILGMDNCELQNIFNFLGDLQTQIISLQATVENGGIPPTETTDDIDTPTYGNVSTDLQAPIGGVTVPCGTTAEKDALYAACAELANYIIAQQTDFYEIFQQSVSRLPELADQLISAIPLVETLPVDEIISTVEYFSDEAEEIWEAVNTSDREQDFRCLLFCAALANDCKLTPELVLSALASQAPSTLQDFMAKSARDLLAIMIVGQPLGDEFYYSQLYFQVQIVLMGERWLEAQGWRPYEMRFLSGLNSPDNDWSIFCTDCPDWAFYQDFRFWTDDAALWEVVQGTNELEYFEGEDIPLSPPDTRSILQIKYTAPEQMKILAIGVDYTGFTDCGISNFNVSTFNDATPVQGNGISNMPVAHPRDRRTLRPHETLPPNLANVVTVSLDAKACGGSLPAMARIHGVRLWYTADSPTKGLLSLQPPTGLPLNGNTDTQWWKAWIE